MKNYVQPGDVLELTAPAGGVLSGKGYLIGDLFGVATMDADAAAKVNFQMTGVVLLAKTSAQVWTEGQPIYYDNANKRADSSGAVGRLIGHATAAAANPSATGYVKLLGGASLGAGAGAGALSGALVEGSAAQTSLATAGNATYTAAQLLSGSIVRDCAGGARTDTLPTAALLVAAIPGAEVGMLVKTYIVNGSDAAEAITLAAGVGGAFDANQTAASRVIGQNTSKLLHCRLTNVGAGTEAYECWA